MVLPENAIKQYALIYSPPTLAISFEDTLLAHSKRRKIVLKESAFTLSTSNLAQQIIENNSDIFIPSHYSIHQLENLLEKLRNHMKDCLKSLLVLYQFIRVLHSLFIPLYIHLLASSEITAETLKTIDLNKMTTEEGMRYKHKMDEEFYSNQIKPGDKGYKYDLRQNFDDTPKTPSDWD